MEVNLNTQPTTPVPDSELVIVMPNVHTISNISMERPTAKTGSLLQLTKAQESVTTVPVVPRWTFGRQTRKSANEESTAAKQNAQLVSDCMENYTD